MSVYAKDGCECHIDDGQTLPKFACFFLCGDDRIRHCTCDEKKTDSIRGERCNISFPLKTSVIMNGTSPNISERFKECLTSNPKQTVDQFYCKSYQPHDKEVINLNCTGYLPGDKKIYRQFKIPTSSLKFEDRSVGYVILDLSGLDKRNKHNSKEEKIEKVQTTPATARIISEKIQPVSSHEIKTSELGTDEVNTDNSNQFDLSSVAIVALVFSIWFLLFGFRIFIKFRNFFRRRSQRRSKGDKYSSYDSDDEEIFSDSRALLFANEGTTMIED